MNSDAIESEIALSSESDSSNEQELFKIFSGLHVLAINTINNEPAVSRARET